MSRDAIVRFLQSVGACDIPDGLSITWARSLPEKTTFAEAWTLCEDGEWLGWLVGALHKRGALSQKTAAIASRAASSFAVETVLVGDAKVAVVSLLDAIEAWATGRGEAHAVFERSIMLDVPGWSPETDAARDALLSCMEAANACDSCRRESVDLSTRLASSFAVAAVASSRRGSKAYDWSDVVAEIARSQREVASAIRVAVSWSEIEDAILSLLRGSIEAEAGSAEKSDESVEKRRAEVEAVIAADVHDHRAYVEIEERDGQFSAIALDRQDGLVMADGPFVASEIEALEALLDYWKNSED